MGLHWLSPVDVKMCLGESMVVSDVTHTSRKAVTHFCRSQHVNLGYGTFNHYIHNLSFFMIFMFISAAFDI